ncbi:MAG: DUF2336 domain-containing protein [Tagaea sp.]|nr:DUF2336 domain-containing protein [Azospirillum sp.]MCZ8123461.1 DUF2336 domain-containing protein [Magnetospirillum sp.]
MAGQDYEQLQGLLLLAQDKRPESRASLAARMGDLILGDEFGAMSARERDLAEDILQRLLHDLEMPIRRALAERLAPEGVAPRKLIVQLANDRIEVAWPVLVRSELLDDSELLNVVRTRTLQHRLAVARRERLSEPLSDALVRPGEADVLRAVLENKGAEIAFDTFETLVRSSEADADLQELILRREDLDPRLAGRMYAWVSEALRRHIVENFDVEPTLLDRAIDAALAEVVADHARAVALNGTIQRIRFALDRGELDDLMTLLPLVRAGERALFESLFAKYVGVSIALGRRILHEEGGRAFALACKGTHVDKGVFTEILLALRAAGGGGAFDPGELFEALGYWDQIEQNSAETLVDAWRRGEIHSPLAPEPPAPRRPAAELPPAAPVRNMYGTGFRPRTQRRFH